MEEEIIVYATGLDFTRCPRQDFLVIQRRASCRCHETTICTDQRVINEGPEHESDSAENIWISDHVFRIR